MLCRSTNQLVDLWPPKIAICQLPVQSANKLPLYRATQVNLTHPAFLGLLFFFSIYFFFALILLDIAFVHIFNAINSLSEHCLSREGERRSVWGEECW